MPRDYLHNHSEFADLIRIVAADKGIDPGLVEKDYWIMHCLYGLQKLGLTFELKGGPRSPKVFRSLDGFRKTSISGSSRQRRSTPKSARTRQSPRIFKADQISTTGSPKRL